MWGSWIAVINKIIYKKNYILRCGYEMYQNELHRNNFIRKRLYFFISYISYIFSNKIVVTTQDIKKFIIEYFHISSAKIVVIPNFINTKKFKNLNQKKTNNCLFVGRLSEEKNLFKVFDFLNGTKKKLFIIGNGKIKTKLVEYKKNLKINVSFLKNIKNNNLPRVYNKFKFFLY